MNQFKQHRKAGPVQGIIITLTSMLPMMAIVALMPIVPAISQNFKNIPNINTWAPLVLSAPGFCIAIISPYAGYLMDKFGRKKLLVTTMILYGIGGVAPFFITSFPVLMGSRLILGIGEAFIMTIANVLLGDYFEPEQRAKWLMVQGIAGPFLGIMLLSLSGNLAVTGWQYPFLVYGVAFIIALATWLYIFEPQKSKTLLPPGTFAVKMPLKLVAKLCSITLIASTIYFVYTLQFSLALDAIGIKDRAEIGNISAVVCIAVPIGALIFKLFSKKPIRLQLLIVSIFIGTGLTGIGSSGTTTSVMIFAAVQQLGCGMTMPVLIAWGLNTLPAEFRGRGMGFWSGAFFLGQFISPLVVTAVRWLSGSLLSAFVVFGIVCLVFGLLNYLFSKKGDSVIFSNEISH